MHKMHKDVNVQNVFGGRRSVTMAAAIVKAHEVKCPNTEQYVEC